METEEEREAYLKELGEKYPCPLPCKSVLPKIISAGYNALQLIYFFTGGKFNFSHIVILYWYMYIYIYFFFFFFFFFLINNFHFNKFFINLQILKMMYFFLNN